MPVQNDALRFDRVATTVGTNAVANIGKSGQLGLGPSLQNLDGATPLVMPQVIPVVLSMPTMFDRIPEFAQLIKDLIERHTKTISGIDPQYTLEVGNQPVGRDGQTVKMPTQSRRADVSPSFGMGELTGNLVWRAIKTWITMARDVDTQAAFTATALQNVSGATVNPQLLSTFSMDMLFIVPDTTMRPGNILDAWQIVGMFPTDTTAFGARKEAGGADQIPDREIPFTGVLQHNANTFLQGQQVMQTLALHLPDYNYAPVATRNTSSILNGFGIRQESAIARRVNVPAAPMMSAGQGA